MYDVIQSAESWSDSDQENAFLEGLAESMLEHRMSNIEWIQQRLVQAFPDAIIHVEDTRGDDQHLAVTICAAGFLGKSIVACHKMVYAALDQMRQGRIHAMSLKTKETFA